MPSHDSRRMYLRYHNQGESSTWNLRKSGFSETNSTWQIELNSILFKMHYFFHFLLHNAWIPTLLKSPELRRRQMQQWVKMSVIIIPKLFVMCVYVHGRNSNGLMWCLAAWHGLLLLAYVLYNFMRFISKSLHFQSDEKWVKCALYCIIWSMGWATLWDRFVCPAVLARYTFVARYI